VASVIEPNELWGSNFKGTVMLGLLEYKLPVSITGFETKVIRK